MSTRHEIADALTGTGLVRVGPTYRPTLAAGEGFVKWHGRVRDDSGLGWIDTWQAWIGLTSDVVAAELWLATHLATLVDVLDGVLVVTAVDPADLVLGANVIPGLILEGVRAADPPVEDVDPVTPYVTKEV